ncbi:DUF4031 domain-containing protein [Mycobacterium avium]|uniref:DUF4031 domain-containing protein n=1 Tax=Mycobacterium avium TaxID=1764 RepID=UPI001CDB1BDA|nr:DUF4031 domain-containing protein [Mycobacterium avium]MCA2337252.1 DUF4031 domain-containing protein [Mycobacterium avium]
MTVYVDDMRLPANVNGVFARWSHLMADTDGELHTFAKRLGLKREWAQKPGTWESHYDVTDRLRTAAIRQGAVPIGVFSAETLALMARRMAQCD